MLHEKASSELDQEFKHDAGVNSAEAQYHGGAIDPQFEKATVRKIDRRLLIILGALYSISLVDRANLGLARVAGMARDLELTVGERFSIVTLLFFTSFSSFLPTFCYGGWELGIFWRRLRYCGEVSTFRLYNPLRFTSARDVATDLAIIVKVVVLAMGFVNAWQQLAALRVLLGLLEAGFFPGCFLLVQTWYTRYETQKRIAVFYSVGMIVVGFSQIFSYGVSTLDGIHGLAGWRWIFIIMGAITIGFGLISFFLIVDFPDKNKFLTVEETALVIERVNRDRGDALPDKVTGTKILKHLSDPRVWAYAVLFACCTLPGSAFAFFMPVILSGAGYSTVLSLCLSAPPWIAASLYTFLIAFFADKTKKRGIFICFNNLVAMVGLLIVSYTEQRGVRYFGCFMTLMGGQANVPAVLAYSANNIVSQSKRAVSSAVTIGSSGIGGIIASTTYRQQDYPGYFPGLWVTIGAQMIAFTIVGILTWHFTTENKKADQGKRGPIEGHPGFRYTI